MLLVGATGSGKSSLLRSATGVAPSLMGLDARGAIGIEAARIGYVPQDAIDGFVSFDAEHEFVQRLRAAGASMRDARRGAAERLDRLELSHLARTPLHALSGGERRRLLLAAVQAARPQILLLDEPFNHVDEAWAPRIFKDLAESAKDRLVLVATHDPRPWQGQNVRTLALRNGTVVADTTLESLDPDVWPELRLAPRSFPQPPTRHEGPIVELDDVDYEAGSNPILRGVRARFGPGLHALTGPNGAGKTTLLKLIAGLLRPTRGTIRVHGAPAKASLQLEEPGSMFFATTCREELSFAPRNRRLPECDVNARLREAVSDFELDAYLERHPYTLSGGERERLALGCLQSDAGPIVLLDEPTQGLDANGRATLAAFLRRTAERSCVIVATHDEEIIQMGSQVHRLERGRLVQTMEAPPRIPS